jgi:adenylate cyclase
LGDNTTNLEEVIETRFSQVGLTEPVLRLWPFERLRNFFASLGRGMGGQELEEETLALVALLGLDDQPRAEEFAALLAKARAAGMGGQDAGPVAQAYYRGIARIVEAEAAVTQELVGRVDPDERAAVLDRLLAMILQTSPQAFAVLHTSLLQRALLDDLTAARANGEVGPLGVALVDLSGSTAYLAEVGVPETEELVDALFVAGQIATLSRSVRLLKHVGDGMFIVGRDVAEVTDACFAAIDQIERSLPLPARAGVAYGSLVRRAGDYFGFPVNVAQLLTKVAKPSQVLATRQAAALVPTELRGRSRRVRIPGGVKRCSVVEIGR